MLIGLLYAVAATVVNSAAGLIQSWFTPCSVAPSR
jgi:hypothetical protein